MGTRFEKEEACRECEFRVKTYDERERARSVGEASGAVVFFLSLGKRHGGAVLSFF